MARVLDLKQGKKAVLDASSPISMEPLSKSLEHDFVLAMISVIPAAVVWIALNQFYIGIALGVAIFATAEYGYPAYRAGRIDLTPAIEVATNIRDMIRSRVLRRA